MIEVTIVFDNYKGEPGFETGWGYSCVVKRNDEFLLFDTGADGQKLIKNLKRAGITPSLVSKIILSHAHKDHTGGLKEIQSLMPEAEIYAGVSFYKEAKKLLPYARLFKVSSEVLRITQGVYLTGELEGKVKETSLVLEAKDGVIVLTGCAHPGIEKIIEKVISEINPKVLAILGGLHLLDKNAEEIRNVIACLESKDVRLLAPSHCTGDLALKLFKQHFKERFLKVGVGTKITFESK
ncbi:MBL fold metallo-hydrolase [Thermodesulfobacterium thermophilum]|uniref:MBL fold metallo-hydrolase n=1 Tax=Thermodesulfobacterium thermophilum TaxID=886 RepID=UPI0003B5B959|nr:MBL fold metallo-hydrolase [Thermodesulfobacterium thermophilum]